LETLHRNQRGLRLGAALLLMLLPALPTHARVRHGDAWARENFARANRMREALNGRPAQQRSRRDYQRVIDSYRRIYFGAPSSSKADPSVVAVAELQVEMGRRFDDNKTLQAAVRQYEFLRREYPGSKYRFDALFTIGEIYKDDLEDPEEALATFSEFLRRYPRSRLAEQARQEMAELKPDRPEPQKTAAQREAEKYQRAADFAGRPTKAAAKTEEIARTGKGPENADAAEDDAGNDEHPTPDADDKTGKLPRVTSIRHWSTPDYTRVAIDLEQDVKFGSQRIKDPDRIFFDLYDTKLASTLVGKSFDVDDGFLKKIRVAQFKPGKTRVVLEVDDLSDYDAFLLPNPSRLIIDIHGKQSPKSEAKKKEMLAADAKANVKEVLASTDKPEPSKSHLAEKTVDDESAAESTNADDSEAAAENTKPRVETIRVGKNPVKKIIEAGDEEPSRKTATVARKVEDARPDVLASKTASADDFDDSKVSDAPVSEKKPATRGKGKHKSSKLTEDIAAREARPTAAGGRSLIRALGLKIGKIVIDPGHGGHDTGTIGPDGLLEKDLVVDVGRRLGKLLEARLGAEVVYTRKDDTFIPLETRTAIANQEQADLFVSVHANSSRDPNARGVETYYLNFTSSADALEVAARENAVSEKSIHELGDLVKKIALKEKIEESHEFASDVQEALHSGLATRNSGIRNRGVKKAPFIVLIGANMPSILAEISFVSNPSDERNLKTPEYRQKIAESLYRGIAKYVSGLSGVKLASKVNKDEGQ
jgi:N-acetylmuramoyl-L-alanine amidase